MQEPTTILTITEDEFWGKYKPIINHLDDNASWNGCMYETYGDERQYCFDLAEKENRVWTIIETSGVEFDPDEEEDDDEVYDPMCVTIISGFHWINRMGFLITEKAYEEDTEVKIDY